MFLIKNIDSIAAVAAKAQQDPHPPWFLTAVTLPRVFQLTEEDIETIGGCESKEDDPDGGVDEYTPNNWDFICCSSRFE
jgi:hypothetical protein